MRISLDSAWKEILREFLLPMIESVLPELYAQIDLNEKPQFLDNEVESLAHELSSLGGNAVREVDLLADLPLKNKLRGSVRILLHCEVQGKGSKENLNLRMYRYKILLELRYKKPIIALAIITEPLPKDQMAGEYKEINFGTNTKLTYSFDVLKVFEASEDLQASDNPFDLAQLAAARAWRARKSEDTRLEYLKELVKLLDERGWDHKEKYNLVKFLETILKIRTPELQADYLVFIDKEKADKTKEDKTMLMIEERGIKQGRKEGLQVGRKEGLQKGLLKGKLETARNMFKRGFDLRTVSEITGLSESELS